MKVKVTKFTNGVQAKVIENGVIELFKMSKDENSGDITITVGVERITIPRGKEQNRVNYLIRKVLNN